MRLALVSAWPWPEVRRGGERYLDDLATWLAGRGHQVTVVTGTRAAPGDTVDALGVRRLRVPLVVPAALARRRTSPVDWLGVAIARSLWRLRSRVDLVHALMPSAGLAARAAGHRTLWTVLGHPTDDQLGIRPADERIFAAATRHASEVAALSAASAEQVAALFGRRPRVLPPGVDLTRFLLRAEPRTGPPRLLFASDAADPRKGLDVVLAALPRVLAAEPTARLLLGGPGDPATALAAATPEVRAAVDVLGVGTPADVPARLRAATVTVLPSVAEAFGLTLVESLASGTPVVCSADGGMPDIVAGPDVGRVVPPRDADALARALLETVALARRPETAAACAAAAARWSWDVVGPQHEQLYDELRATPARQ